MLEKEPWSNKSDNVFRSGNSKSINEASSLASDNFIVDTPSTEGELSGKESVPIENHVAVGESVGYQHSIPEADNDLSFFDNNVRKDPNDLLCYSWDDLENFDRMFRSCDSTFGLGTSQEDGWLSLPDANGESEDVLKSDFKFSCPDSSSEKSMSECEDTLSSNGMACSINESEVQNASDISKGSGQLGKLSSSNGTSFYGGANIKDKVIPKGQVCAVSLGGESRHVGQQKMSHSFGYSHSDTTFMSSYYCFPSENNFLHPAQCASKSENSRLLSVSPKDSYSLKLKQAMDSQASSLQAISIGAGEKGEQINQPKKFQAYSNSISENIDFVAQTSMSNAISDENPINYSGKRHRDVANKGIHREVSSSVAQGSSVSSRLDYISIEATSFSQLQLVIVQLDLRTKLCIRDSLYRLAGSAEQKHQYVKLNGGPIGDRDSMLAEGSTKFPEFMDMETDTNPIDRSIAHLLFHKPADSPVCAGRDALSFNSRTPWLFACDA